MNKFVVFACLKLEEAEGSEYEGSVVVLAHSADPSLMLFFPVSEQDALVISNILNDDDNANYDVDVNILGIYATMLASWRAGDRYLSGIAIDTTYNDDMNKEIPLVRLILSDHNGMVESFVRVNFIHAVLLAAMENVDIIINDKLLNIMLPNSEKSIDEIKTSHDGHFPEDKNIINIAKKIMEGRINEDNDNSSKRK